MSSAHDVYRFDVERVTQETDKAILVVIADTGDERWVPKSVIHDDSEVFDLKNGEGELVLLSWFVEKNGWDK